MARRALVKLSVKSKFELKRKRLAPKGCRYSICWALKRKTGQMAGEPLLLPIDIDPEPVDEKLTAWGGAALLVQAIRSLDVPGSTARHVQIKQRQRGLVEAEYVESLVVLHALGGDCVDDLNRLREDAGIAEVLGYQPPSPEAARKFLNHFHEDSLIEQAQQALALERSSYIPQESAALAGLAEVNRDVIGVIGRRVVEQRIATVDLDSTIIESWKQQANKTYEGSTGYQPMLALWAEMDVVLADEFRDGNVPAIQEPQRVARRAFAALPETVSEYRGDSACYEQELLTWLRDEKREAGPRGQIGFAVSVPMHAPLREELEATAEDRWQPYGEDSGAEKECAVVNYYPKRRRTGIASHCATLASGFGASSAICWITAGRCCTLRWQPTCGTGSRGGCWNGTARKRALSKRCTMCLRMN
jgi:hypothetical protein